MFHKFITIRIFSSWISWKQMLSLQFQKRHNMSWNMQCTIKRSLKLMYKVDSNSDINLMLKHASYANLCYTKRKIK